MNKKNNSRIIEFKHIEMMTGCMHTTGELVAEHVGVPSGRAVPALVFELRLAHGDAQARALFNAR